jgi:hypothetical protein
VNVFRFHREQSHTSFDIWIDAKTKRLVGLTDPGTDCFDLATAPDRNNPPENKISKGELAGSVTSNIVFDAQLDANLFSLTPPEGFQFVPEPPRPTVTEADLIEWLGVTARFNNGAFADTPFEADIKEKHNQAARKDKADRTDAEQRYLDLWSKQALSNRHSYPIWDFAEEYAVPGSFRYLGKGVKLGDKDRIVCWYKLKDAKDPKTYRVVYGDLSVKTLHRKIYPCRSSRNAKRTLAPARVRGQ